MSHVKNMQAFGKLKGICTGYGGAYNPGQQNLQVNAMTTLMLKAQQTMEEVNEAQVFYDNATNNREQEFTGLQRQSSRVVTVLKSSGAHELTVKDAQATNRKIWGRIKNRSLEVTEPKPDQEKQKSSFGYGQDFATLAYQFARLVETVEAEPKYQPNEKELSVKGLKLKLALLQQLNETVTQAEIRLTQARRARNELYYKAEDSLMAIAIAVKQYIRGAFGYKSPQHLEVQKVRFTKPSL